MIRLWPVATVTTNARTAEHNITSGATRGPEQGVIVFINWGDIN
jgi:hypothetical protein